MRIRTVFLGRLAGIYLLVIAAWMFAKKPAALAIITEMLGDRPLLLVVAIFALLAGLAMVLGHTIWSGGALTVLVTLTGWILLIRSLLLLFVPPTDTLHLLERIQFTQFFYLYMAIPLVLGAVLTYLGFRARVGDGAGS